MKGYTLIEILVTLSIISILSLSTVSFVRIFISKNEQSVEVRRLVGALQYTRMEAICRGEIVIFCGSSDFQKCDGNWPGGQIVKVKNEVLRVFSSRQGGYWEWRSNLGKNQQLEFSSLGFTHGQQGSFYYHTFDQKRVYRIVVSYSGNIRIEKL